MASSIKYEDNFIVAGSAYSRLSPDFKIKEFFDADNLIYIHRELVSGLQILRNRTANGISIIRPKAPASMVQRPTGLGVVIKSGNLPALEKTAKKLKSEGYFLSPVAVSSGLYLEIPSADAMPAMRPETAFDCSMQITASI